MQESARAQGLRVRKSAGLSWTSAWLTPVPPWIPGVRARDCSWETRPAASWAPCGAQLAAYCRLEFDAVTARHFGLEQEPVRAVLTDVEFGAQGRGAR